MNSRDKKEKQKRIAKILRVLKKLFPEATTSLRYSNNLELLVAVMLSAQCTDKKVNEVTEKLFKEYRTIDDYADATPAHLEQCIFQTGFYRNKSKNIISMARMLRGEYKGRIPKTMDEMIRLPGVARKTANVVLGNAFGIVEGIAVDTHVQRLVTKWGLTDSRDAQRIEKELMELLPREEWFSFTNRVIEYGRTYCPAKRHDHDACPIRLDTA